MKRVAWLISAIMFFAIVFSVGCAKSGGVEVIEYVTVVFDTDGGSPAGGLRFAVGDDVDVSTVKTSKTGYTFGGWIYDGKVIEDGVLRADGIKTKTVKFTPKWIPNKYTVSYDTDGGEEIEETTEVTFDEVYSLVIPEKEGYKFVGWAIGDEVVDSEIWKTAENVTVKAKWIYVGGNDEEKCVVTFVKGGTPIDVEVDKGGSLSKDKIPALDVEAIKGYTLSWSVTDFSEINEDITVYIVKTPKTYKVTLDAGEGTVNGEKTVEIEVVFGEPYSGETEVLAYGKLFNGWENNGSVLDLKEPWEQTEEKVVLKALWKVKIIKVTLDMGEEGTVNGEKTVVIEVEYGKPYDGEIAIAFFKTDEYDFKYWKLNDKEVDLEKPWTYSEEDVVLSAVYSRRWTKPY